jgi:ubiquinone/menaquinone biosynthesis C-methylase UbiE
MGKAEVEQWYQQMGADMVGRMGISAGERVLDFGCGEGGMAVPAAQVVGQEGCVMALDVKARNLKTVRRRANEAGVQRAVLTVLTDGGMYFPCVTDSSLDGVLLFDVLHHVDDWEGLFEEVRRTLKDEGRLYVNPSCLSHPGKVDVDEMDRQLGEQGLTLETRRRFRLMHYKRLAEDEVFVYAAQ